MKNNTVVIILVRKKPKIFGRFRCVLFKKLEFDDSLVCF